MSPKTKLVQCDECGMRWRVMFAHGVKPSMACTWCMPGNVRLVSPLTPRPGGAK